MRFSYFRILLKQRSITVAGKRVTEDVYLRNGDTVEVFADESKLLKFNFETVYRDENVIIAVKPRGISSEEFAGRVSSTENVSAVLAHRLDTNTRGLIVMSLNAKAEAELAAPERTSLHACRNEIREVLRRLREQLGERWNLVRGIGFADPGLVDVEKGISIRAVNVPGWENAQTGKWLESENAVRAKLWPECTVKTYMEYLSRLHAEKPPKSLFHLGMDDGIGGGFVKDGVCFIGDSNQGMEIGHIVIAPNGPLCQCGNRGCLEAVAGETGIRRRIREALNSGVDTEMTLEGFSLAKFVEYARHDKAAKIIANEVCDSIGSALAVAVALLNPSMIVLSGELTKLGTVLTNAVTRALSMNCFAGALRELKIELSTLGAFDTARGAALLMRDALLKEEN